MYISGCDLDDNCEIEYIKNILERKNFKLSNKFKDYGDFTSKIINNMIDFVKILYGVSSYNKADTKDLCVYKLLNLILKENSNTDDVLKALQNRKTILNEIYDFFTKNEDVVKLSKILNGTGDEPMYKKQKKESETIAVKNKHFETAQEAYDNMLKSGKLAQTLRKCTIERYTEADLSRVHEDRRNGYNRIDLTHNNGVPVSIFVYYKEKLIFHIEAYDNFGSMVSDDITLNLSRGQVDTFLKNVCRTINSLAGKAEKGNVLNEEN